MKVTVFFVEHQRVGPVMSRVALVCAQCVAEAMGVPEDDVATLDGGMSAVRFPI